MQPKTNRLLMLLVGAVISGCASQTDRSSSGGGAQAQSEPEKESVQYVDRPLDESPPPKPPAVAVAPKAAAPKDEATPDFPITKYELPEEQAKDEEVEDLGPQEDESASAEQEAAPAEESSVGETTENDDDQEADAGEVEDLGPQEDESASAEQEAAPAEESSVGETTEYADEQEAADSGEVEDLGTQPDDSGTVSFPEEKRASADNEVSEPKVYPDEPAPKVATAAPKSISVSFETEPLFNFDKSEVRADQRTKLDEFISGLSGTQYDSIAVVGHADRIGKDAYNQKLSERRAAAVKAYLVKKGVPSEKIQTEGHGKSESVTGDACNNVHGKALISCLQPDRRVDVNTSATKQSN
jgi:outer membrane protein OmpA-like peptidoglycan-associated protein